MHAFSFVGDSGVGKTTLLERLVEQLRREGIDVAVVKHSKGFDDPDPPRKDSRRLREAGARRVVLASPARTVLVWEHPGEEPAWDARAAMIASAEIVLVESYAAAGLPVIEVLRGALPRRTPRMEATDPRWIGLVCDFEPEGVPPRIRRFGFEDIEGLGRFLVGWRPP